MLNITYGRMYPEAPGRRDALPEDPCLLTKALLPGFNINKGNVMVNLIPARCPNCGADLQFPDTLKIGYCSHCGGKVLIEENSMQVHHTGAVSSLPLCPNCGNTLTEGNRLFKCEICEKQECYFCSKLNSREQGLFQSAANMGRIVNDGGRNLCREHQRQRVATCIACDPIGPYGLVSGRPSGMCSQCHGTGKIGSILKKPCSYCNGTGRCPVCFGSCWVRIVL